MSLIETTIDTIKISTEKCRASKKFDFSSRILEEPQKINLTLPLIKVSASSVQLPAFKTDSRTPTAPDLEEVFDINRRINILQHRKRYILAFYKREKQNKAVLVNQFFKPSLSFNFECITQRQQNWKLYEGQIFEAQFHGIGNLKYPNVKVHGSFANGQAEGVMTIFDGNKVQMAEYRDGLFVKFVDM